MGVNIWFWLIYVLCVVFGTWLDWPAADRPGFRPVGRSFVVFILLGLLGFRVFGSPIQ